MGLLSSPCLDSSLLVWFQSLPPLLAGRGCPPMGPIHAVGTAKYPRVARIFFKSRAVLALAGSGYGNGMIARLWS